MSEQRPPVAGAASTSAQTEDPYAAFPAPRIHHLEMIQTVISRLATDGFLMKGWAITLATAVFGFGLQSKSWPLALFAMPSSFALWALDAYFLRCERLFRELFRRVAERDAVLHVRNRHRVLSEGEAKGRFVLDVLFQHHPRVLLFAHNRICHCGGYRDRKGGQIGRRTQI